MKHQNIKTGIVLFPPRLEVNSLTNKYDLLIDVKWGEFTKQIKVTKEEGGFITKLILELNQALLEVSEMSPFTK